MTACSRLIAAGGKGADVALAYTGRAVAHLDRNERDRAIADLEQALIFDQQPAPTHRNRGLLHAVRREWPQAVAAYDEAIRLDPKSARTWRYRAAAHRARDHLDRALADYDRAIQLDAKDAFAFNGRARTHEAKGDFERARADFDTAIRLEPQFTVALNNRGVYWRHRSEFDRALTDHDAALRIEPTFTYAYQSRGLAWYEKGDWTRALADFDAAIRLDPNYASAYNWRGNARRKLGDRTGSMADYDKAIALEPTAAAYYSNRGHLFASMGDQARALADFKAVLELPAPTAADKQRLEVARERLARAQSAGKSTGSEAITAAIRHRRVALVIGNGRYANASPLANPVSDARAITAALRRLDFTHVVELYDATREPMAQALKDFGDKVEGAEWALVFFAGHGIEIGGTTYLVPIDAALKRDAHVADEAISLDRVLAKADGASKLGLVILDSCRNNPFATRMIRSAGATRSVGRGLTPIEPEGNVLVAYAARHGTVAEDGTGRNSPFTTALLAHIEARGIEVNLLFRKVRDDVRAATAKRQDPFVYGSLGSEALYFKASSR